MGIGQASKNDFALPGTSIAFFAPFLREPVTFTEKKPFLPASMVVSAEEIFG
jgi:hypothetical protein